MNINPFIDLINNILVLYSFVLASWVVMSWFISFRIINVHQQLVQQIIYILDSLTKPTVRIVRRYIPPIGGVDVSVIVLFLAISFIRNFLYTYLYK